MKLGIETNYTDLGKIQYLIANRNLDQLEPVYTDKVEMTVFVPTDEMGSLRAELMEGTNGQVVLDEETTCWFARTEDGIKIFDNRLHGFANPDSILTGMETRSSSPVRILRDENLVSNIRGIYPCGEGAGYAGGIMSAAVDGIKCAIAAIK